MQNELAGTKSRCRSIMIVDDNAANLLVASTLLGMWGYEYQVAGNGAEAVELFQKEAFGLILMDLQMPVMSGLDATKMIRHYEEATSRTPTPIIALTASNVESYRRQCLGSGMDDLILKPYSAEELESKISSYLA